MFSEMGHPFGRIKGTHLPETWHLSEASCLLLAQALKNRELRWFLAIVAALAAIWLLGDFLPRRLAASA